MNSNNKPVFFIIDGNSFIHRAYHAMKGLSNSSGFPTGAIYGALNMIINVKNRFNPDVFVVAFDAKGKNFRHELFPEYKANRPPTPEDLKVQFPVVKELVEAWGAPILEEVGVEADDSMCSLAIKAKNAGYFVVMSTSDKDMRQCVDEDIYILDTKSADSHTPFGREGVFEKDKVYPELIIDKLSLMGDTADNISGVDGCGDVTAVKWLNEFGSLDNVVKNADNIGGKIGERLRASLHLLPLAKKLVTIKTDVIIDREPHEFVFKSQSPKAMEIINKYELFRLKKHFEQASDATKLEYQISEDVPFDLFYSKKAFYLDMFNIDEEKYYFITEKYGQPIYYFKGNDNIDFLSHILSNKITLCTNDGKEVLKSISLLTNKAVFFDHVIHDIRVADYTTSGGRSSEAKLGFINDTYGQLQLSNLRTEFKLDDKTPQYKKMSFEQIISAKAEELALCSYLFAKKVFNTKSKEYKIDSMLVPVLSIMELNGAKIDADGLTVFGKKLDARIEETQNKIFEIAGQPFNISSPKQVGEILFDVLGIPTKKKSTAEKVLSGLIEEYPIIQDIFDFRSLAKLKNTFVDGLLSRMKGDRVHTTYKQTVTSTGRLSSTDPNLQNIPIRTEDGKNIRKAFIARDKYKILAADYSQIELRVLAHMANEENLLKAFLNNEDVHKTTASLVMGIPLDDVTSDHRRIAKGVNFGLIYGLSANNLAKDLGIDPKEAKNYYQVYFEKFSNIKPYFETVLATAKKDLCVSNEFGRKLPTRDVNSSNGMVRSHAELSAKNAPIQGTAADIIKFAMIEVARYMTENNSDALLLMQVHDELVFEVKEEIAESFALDIQSIMANVIKLKVPLVVDYNIADNWLEAH